MATLGLSFDRLPGDTLANLTALSSYFAQATGSVKFKQLSRLLKRSDHAPILDLSVDPRVYTSADALRWDWLAVNLARKSPFLRVGIDTKEVARKSFYEAEARCRLTNQRLSSRFDTPTTGVSGDSLIEAARLKISRVLGQLDLNEVAAFFGFSSGASTRLSRSRGEAYFKYGGKPQVTRKAALAGLCAIWSVPVWKDRMTAVYGRDPFQWVEIVDGSRLDFVPKNAKTDRSIAIEPCLNMHMQLGTGTVIRRRLRRVGIDLDDQSINQKLAYEGSVTGLLATLDLASASDTISFELVRRLLPPDWFEWLDLIRSHQGAFPNDSEIVVFEKFSSMGNGFTFELESLIFWALTSVVVDSYIGEDKVVSVYGDDIICPTACAGFVTELLEYCGFQLNTEKSFVSGPFRESCGKHYFRGTDVTPIACKDTLTDWSDVYWLYNSILTLGEQDIVDERLEAILSALWKCVPREKRCCVPPTYGNRQGFYTDASFASWDSRRQCYSFSALTEVVGFDVECDGSRRYLAVMQMRPNSVTDVSEGERAYGTVKFYKRYTRQRRLRCIESAWSTPPIRRYY